MPDEFRRIIPEADFPEDGKYAARAGAWYLLIVRSGGGYHAFNDRCTHGASPLSTGRVRRGVIMCPLHGARFDLTTGACIGGPYQPLRRFEVRVADGCIEVAVPTSQPGVDDLPFTE